MINKYYALKISLVYLLFGVLWALLSDSALSSFFLSSQEVTFFSIIVDWMFVGLSALLIYIMSKRYIHKLTRANQIQQDSYNELTATYEELTATEEELRQQFDEILQSHQKINTQNIMLSTIQETMIDLINELDTDTLLNKIVKTVSELAETPHSFIYLLDKEKKFFYLKVGLGLFKNLAGIFKIDRNLGQVGQVLQTGQISIVENYESWDHRIDTPQISTVKSAIHIPLQSEQKTIGTIGLAYTELCQHFDKDQIELLKRFAALASIALDNAKLHTQLRQELEEISQKEETIKTIFDGTSDAIFVHDAKSAELITCNSQAEELLGFTLEEMQHMGIAKLDICCYQGHLVETIRNFSPEVAQLIEVSATNKQGVPLYLETNPRKVTIGNEACILSVVRNISERKKSAAELAYAQQQKIALLNAIPDLMFLYNKQGVYLDCHRSTSLDFFVPPEQFLGKSVVDVIPNDIARKTLIHIQKAINEPGISHVFEFSRMKENRLYWLEARFVKSGQNEALAIIRDITYKKQMEQRLEFFGLHDALTGVYNRTYFEEEVRKINSRNDKSAGIIVCDVDGLKLINDTLGHRAGDELLKVVATTLTSCSTVTDIVARIGGDEFAIITVEPDQKKMIELSAAIKATVKQYNKTNLQLPLSLSTGWAIGFNTIDIDALFKEADNNMYREKMHQGLSNHSAIVQAMMKALEERDFITEGHADRLESLVEKLAQKLQLSDPLTADLKLLAKFHDIGKVGIPDSILLKPSRLTPDEIMVMRSHCDIGFRIAKSAPDLAPIADWILKHQEWWNGKGYPLSLSGEKVPLPCRILSLADAFDAMTNDRPYRKAMDVQEAIDEIRRCAGTQFDPALTEPFIETLID